MSRKILLWDEKVALESQIKDVAIQSEREYPGENFLRAESNWKWQLIICLTAGALAGIHYGEFQHSALTFFAALFAIQIVKQIIFKLKPSIAPGIIQHRIIVSLDTAGRSMRYVSSPWDDINEAKRAMKGIIDQLESSAIKDRTSNYFDQT